MKPINVNQSSLLSQLSPEKQRRILRGLKRRLKHFDYTLDDDGPTYQLRNLLVPDLILPSCLGNLNREMEDSSSPLDELETEQLARLERIGALSSRVKVQLRDDDAFMGPGPLHVLNAIETYGNVRKAAEGLGISYSKVWKIIARLEDALGVDIVTRYQGGRGGGHAQLSRQGQALRDFFSRYQARMDEIAEEYLEAEFPYEIFSDER
ncbi:MAG: LysR family transcriptional regulator [Eubacteriales bacterium]|nr:LysR family transcriptional regulator [Eubacteriales bacterium]